MNTQLTIEILSNLGLLSAATLLVFLVVVRTRIQLVELRGQLLIGIVFGFIAVLVVRVPVTIPLGATFDTRVGPIVLSGVYGGPLAALIAATIGGIARYQVGGPAVVGGVTSFFVYALVGCGAGWIMQRRGRRTLGPVGLLALALAATVLVLPCFFLAVPVATGLAILQNAWYVLLIGNISGTLILGLLTEELQRILLEREAFRQASIAANAGLLAKNRFISSISHDIRTPLNGILGVLQLLERSELSAENRSRVHMAHKAGKYLLDLVNQVLEFARIEGGFETSPPSVFSLAQLLDELQSIFLPLAHEKGLRLTTISDRHDRTPLSGDYDHLRQVLFNLVSNAIRYTDQGSVLVRIGAEDAQPGELTVNFAVEDTGPGIPAADRQRIFEEFVRLGDHTEPQGQTSSGLGLTIARAIVERMDSRLELNSEPGKGAIFFFTLRLAKASEAPAPVPEHHTADAARRRLHLLVVDDNELNRSLLDEALGQLGHTVETLDSGNAAVATISARPRDFDAVLMDVVMPGLSGDEAARLIRDSVPGVRNLPIVAITANALAEQQAHYLQSGMTSVITKPIDFSRLDLHLQRLFQDPAPIVPTREPPPQPPADLLQAEQLQSLAKNIPLERLMEMGERALDALEDLISKLRAPTTPPAEHAEIAHQIKGLAANFGLSRLSALAREAEHLATAGSPVETRIRAMDEALGPSSEALRQWFASTRG